MQENTAFYSNSDIEVLDAQLVCTQSARGFHLKCHQFHEPFFISKALRNSVGERFLQFQDECYILAELIV
jgi:hypothetical protein